MWDIYLKKVELESFIKSFLLFFISQLLLVSVLFFVEFKKEVQSLDENIFSSMRICSFDLKCDEYKIDFAPLKENELYKLYKTDAEISSYFSIPGSYKNALKIYLNKDQYLQKLNDIKSSLVVYYFLVLYVVFLLSMIFSFYALFPLKNALTLTEEFIKDILHDFNTPLSTLRLNTSMLENEVGKNSKITRIQNSINTILNLQTNLRSYLNNNTTQREIFNLDNILDERVKLLSNNSKNIYFKRAVTSCELFVNKDAFIRIIDNLLSNAIKYNRDGGKVYISLDKNILEIKDTGKGIKNPKKVFDRFYKEQDRGIGIGLHIVKKLCDELDIGVRVESKLGVGSSFFLDLSNLKKSV